jgi:hypothetical protein
MRSLIDVFDSKSFGATFVFFVALVAVEGGIYNFQLLAIPLLALAAYWWAFEPDSGVDFVAADNPADRLEVHLLAAFAEDEREQINKRTKDALQAAKSRGVRLGRNGAERLAPHYREDAERARQLAPVLSELRSASMSARQMAAELIARGIPSPNGGRWHAATVLRALDRAGL